MMEDLTIFFLIAIAFYMGWIAREYRAKRTIDRYIAKMAKETYEELKSDLINITVDFSEDGNIFVYKKEDGSYLGHAESRDKLEDILSEKFPGKMFNASPEDLKKLEAR